MRAKLPLIVIIIGKNRAQREFIAALQKLRGCNADVTNEAAAIQAHYIQKTHFVVLEWD